MYHAHDSFLHDVHYDDDRECHAIQNVRHGLHLNVNQLHHANADGYREG